VATSQRHDRNRFCTYLYNLLSVLIDTIIGGLIDLRVLEISSVMVTVFSRAARFFVVVVTAKICHNFLNFRPISIILPEEALG
jgi:hypothetical protein